MSRTARKDNSEIALTSGEKLLLSPNTCWQFLLSNQVNDYENVFFHLAQYTAQQMEKRVVSKSRSSFPSNYFAWSNLLDDEEPRERLSIPGLEELSYKVFKAQIYLSTFPSVHLFFKWDPLIKMGLKRTDYSEEDVLSFLEIEKARCAKQSLTTLNVTLARARDKQEFLTALLKGCTNLEQMIKFSTNEEKERKNASMAKDTEAEKQEEAKSKALSKSLRIALTTATRRLVEVGIVTGATEKFLVDVVSHGTFDMSRLEPKDMQFLCADTQIIRSRNVKGKTIFQLNDLDS